MKILQFNKLNKKLNEKNNLILILFGLICIGFALRLYYIPYQIPIDFDGIDYFAYTVAINKEGNFPIGYLSLNFGWSTFLSPIFSIFPNYNMLELMNVQRIVSSLISTLTIIPIYYLSKIFFKKNISIVISSLFLFEPHIISNSILGITDSIFILFVTLTIMFMFIKETKLFYISFIFAALATFTRYEGFLLIFPILISFLFRKNYDKRNILKLFLGIIIFCSILISINITAYEHNNLNILSPIYAGIKYPVNAMAPDGDTNTQYFGDIIENRLQVIAYDAINGYVKYLGWIMIPIIGLFVIPGFILSNKKPTKNKIILFLFIIFISCASLYAYGRGIQETRYMYPLIPIFILLAGYFLNYLERKFDFKKIMIITITLIAILSICYLEYNKEDYDYEEAIYDASYFIIKNAEGVNDYQGGNLRTAALESSWPELLPMNERMKMSKPVKKIQSYEYDSLEQYLKNNENNKLTHLVIPENHKTPFLKEVFYNEINYPFLKNVYNSQENGFNNEIKIFEINYERFYETEIVTLR